MVNFDDLQIIKTIGAGMFGTNYLVNLCSQVVNNLKNIC
jgi:hypothetical protein